MGSFPAGKVGESVKSDTRYLHHSCVQNGCVAHLALCPILTRVQVDQIMKLTNMMTLYKNGSESHSVSYSVGINGFNCDWRLQESGTDHSPPLQHSRGPFGLLFVCYWLLFFPRRWRRLKLQSDHISVKNFRVFTSMPPCLSADSWLESLRYSPIWYRKNSGA
jgi:hypothetical protein